MHGLFVTGLKIIINIVRSYCMSGLLCTYVRVCYLSCRPARTCTQSTRVLCMRLDTGCHNIH